MLQFLEDHTYLKAEIINSKIQTRTSLVHYHVYTENDNNVKYTLNIYHITAFCTEIILGQKQSPKHLIKNYVYFIYYADWHRI